MAFLEVCQSDSFGKVRFDKMISFKATIPPPFRYGPARLALLNRLRKFGTVIKETYALTTETWDKKPKFIVTPSLSGGQASVTVSTEDPIYAFVDQGTKEHRVPEIVTVSATKLAFRARRRPKTRPNILRSYSGDSGGRIVFVSFVNTEIKPRKFTPTIFRKLNPKFGPFMETAFAQIARDYSI
jgi:hypothetical protein